MVAMKTPQETAHELFCVLGQLVVPSVGLFRLAACVSLLLVTPSLLAAQNDMPAQDSDRVLLFEHRFSSDSSDNAVVMLERRVVYWAEVTGPGAPVFQPVQRHGQPAFLVPITEGAGDQPRRFEVYAIRTGPHMVSLSDLPPGSAAALRLYRDVVATRRIAEARYHRLAVGLLVGGGIHSGYRLDPTGGGDPDGGSDVEGCILAQIGDRFGTCLGVSWQSFPDAGFAATWLFIEERGRLGSGRWLDGRITDVGATVRYGQALSAGPRHLSPGLLALGLYVIHHLAIGGRRGWSLYGAWHHGRLGNAPETELLDTDRFTAGIIWMP